MGRTPKELFEELKDLVLDYAGVRVELLKLNAYERIAKLIALLSQSFIFVLLSIFGILFAFLALAFFLGEWWNNMGLGFLAVFGIYLLLLLILYLTKKNIRISVMNIVLRAILEKEDDDDTHSGNTHTAP